MIANQVPLHPAADVLRNQLLLEVGEENDKLERDITRLEEANDFLGGIELHLGSGRVVSASLKLSFTVNNFNGFPCACVDVVPVPIFLSEFGRGRVSMSGQVIGNFPGIADPILIVGENKDDRVRLKIIFSEYSIVEGEIQGLSHDDFLRFKDKTYGDEQVMNYLVTGRGLQNPNTLLFIPQMIFVVIITPELRETIRVIGPLPKFESFHNLSEHLPVDPNDSIVCPPPTPSDESRLAIVSALGCTDRQKGLLDKNRSLKSLNYRLSKIEERIEMVEISHTKKISASLKNGVLSEDSEGSPVWKIPLRQYNADCSIIVNNIPSLEIVVAGIRLYPKTVTFHEAENGMMYFTGTFDNGTKLFGFFDSESSLEMNMDDFGEIARGFTSGEQLFPPTYALVVTHLYFPLDSVQDALDVLQL